MQVVSTKKLLIPILVFIFFIIFINRTEFLGIAKNNIIKVFEPVLSTSLKISQSTYSFASNFFRTSRDLRSENETLHAQLLEQTQLKAETTRLRMENTSLLNLLHYTSSTLNKISAQVIGVGTESTVQSLIIDRGLNDGVTIGDPIIAEGGILIGTVWKTQEKESIIELITDNQSRIGTSILNKDRSIGIATGSHGLSVEVEMIPQDEVITEGDIAITSGIEKSIPRGLIIGTVLSIKKEASEPFQTARLQLPIELNKLSWVAVLSQ